MTIVMFKCEPIRSRMLSLLVRILDRKRGNLIKNHAEAEPVSLSCYHEMS